MKMYLTSSASSVSRSIKQAIKWRGGGSIKADKEHGAECEVGAIQGVLCTFSICLNSS